MDGARQIGEPAHLGGPLDQRPGDRRQVGPEQRLGEREALVVLAGSDEQRRARLLRVVQHAHGVTEARCDMEIDDGELARRLRVAVGHCQDRRLLQAEDVAQTGFDGQRIHQRQLGGAGIAEQDVDALLL